MTFEFDKVLILVDAHVHIYDCFNLEMFFDSAFANFQKEAARLGKIDAFTAILLLTETSKHNWFEHLLDYADNKGGIGNKAIGKWTFHRTNENHSLCAQRAENQKLLLIAGRQIITAEDLEVLALGAARNIKDGSPVQELINMVKECGAIPVIPYGFGKWMGRRGVILRELLEKVKGQELFLGDNGGCPNFLPRPSHFRQAEGKGIRVLPGTDPLPFASESRRPGSFGFSLEDSINRKQPRNDIRRILLDPTTRPRAYGSLEKTYRFFRNQLAMQILKQRRKRTKSFCQATEI